MYSIVNKAEGYTIKLIEFSYKLAKFYLVSNNYNTHEAKKFANFFLSFSLLSFFPPNSLSSALKRQMPLPDTRRTKLTTRELIKLQVISTYQQLSLLLLNDGCFYVIDIFFDLKCKVRTKSQLFSDSFARIRCPI